MQASYTISGDDGLHAIAQLESRIRHEAQSAGPAATALLASVVGYVRGAVEQTTEPLELEINVVIRARTTQGGISQHLAPPATEGNPAPSTDAEGAEDEPVSDSGGAT